MFIALALLALLIERLVGYPRLVFAAVGHPVTWAGGLLGALDRGWNRENASRQARRRAGAGALLALLLACGLVAWSVQALCLTLPFGILLLALPAAALPAQKSLGEHVEAVARALDGGGLAAGRKAVSMIVGRDPDRLDEAAVCRAAIESLAENFSDGVVAPALWTAALGLPGGVLYKAANTADSMIGHRTARHEAFGWAAARFDDLVNLPASRLTALLLVLAAFLVPGASAANAWRAVGRDAHRHRSPNAGWPEAAIAGALGLALAGPRVYGGVLTRDGVMGAGGRREATSADIRRALRLYWTADALLFALLGSLFGVVFIAHGG
jgi:adenosylcobinamide-phosphate synthase